MKACCLARQTSRKIHPALLGAVLLVFGACGPKASTGSRPASDRAALSERDFFDPPLSARPSVLWAWLNGFVDRDQLTRELEELKAKGLGGAIIWDVGSLSDPRKIIPAGPAFLGPESVASISHAIDEAGRLGLELGLFASSSWNAGGAWIKPENASRQLLCRQIEVQGPGRIRTMVPLPDGVTAHWKDVAVLAVPAGAAAVDISDRMDPQGRLGWDAPAGESRIMRFVASNTGQTLECPSPNSDGLIIDHLSREAATVDMTHILDRILSARKSLDALKTFMLDSYEVREAVDWTDNFIGAFRARHGYDPVPYLPALFDPAALDPGIAARFLYDYRKTVSDLIIDNHFRAVRDLLNKRGVRLLAEAGHGGSARVDALKALGSADIPMGEFWNHERFWVVKEASSAAHIYGRRIVDAETLTGWRSWQDGPAEYKRRFDIALCAGLNHPTFHTFTHNPPAAGRPGFVYHAGEHFNVNTTWWDKAGPLIEYMARCDYLLQQGLFVADVAFYYGDQAPNLVPARRIDPDIEPIYPDTACLHCRQPKPIQTSSLDRGYDYDYVNSEVILDRMKVSGGRIVLPDGLSYALLVLPDRDGMPLEVLRKLGELVEAGATVVGRKPVLAPGLAGFPACDDEVRALADGIWGPCDGAAVKERPFGKGRIVWGIPLDDILRDRGLGPDFRPLHVPNADQHIDFIHRSTGRDDLYFVSNSAKVVEAFDAVFRVGEDRTPEFWYPDTGRIVPCRSFARVEGGCRLTLELPAYGSVFVVFRQTPTPAAYLSPEPLKAEDRPTVAIAGPWTVRFLPGWGAPGSVLWNGLISWAESEDPGIRHFSGTASYTTEFEIDETLFGEGRGLLLDLGALREVAEVTLNGRNLGILWKEPFRTDIMGALRMGRNVLEVKVTNLWNNRLIGDLLSPDQKPLARTNMVLKPRDLIPAGLFGSVTIRRAARRPFSPTWESLSKIPTPQWLRDGKFGIYTHWGVYSVPAVGPNGTWYSHNIYMNPNSPERTYHEATYGPLEKFGYKDFIPMFTGAKFDADEWADLFRRAGARFAGPVAEHHDGFSMWDTAYSDWNAAKMGPKRDIVGELSVAIKKAGLKFVTAFHHAENWYFFPVWDKRYDCGDPRYSGLYGPIHEKGAQPDKAFLDQWAAKVREVIDKYRPDFLWFDFGLGFVPETYKRDLLAHFFNGAAAEGREVVVSYKEHDLPPGVGINDLELGQEREMTYHEWITDSSVDNQGAWGYVRGAGFKTTENLVHNLMDRVSKNGYLLLNVGPKPDGTIPEEARERLLGLGRWLEVNGEAVYGTRPWIVAGEGPTKLDAEGPFNELDDLRYKALDIRFTTKGDVLYATALGWPGERILIKSLAGGPDPGRNFWNGLYPSEIVSVSMLGDGRPLKWEMTKEGITIETPPTRPCAYAYVFKIVRRAPF